MKSSLPKVGIVIRTYYRAHLLHKTLKSITELDYPKALIETLVIVDPGDLQAIEVVNKFTKILDVKVHVIEVNSATYAWNKGIMKSAGEVILIMPDDIYVHPDTISAALKHLSNPRVACVTFPAITIKPTYPEKLHHWRFVGITTQNTFSILAPSVCRKDILENVGLFREDMGPPHSIYEDWELGSRIRSKGYFIVIDGTLSQKHLESTYEGDAESIGKEASNTIIKTVKAYMTYQLKKNWWPFFAVMKVSPLSQKVEYLFYFTFPILALLVLQLAGVAYFLTFLSIIFSAVTLNSFLRGYYSRLRFVERIVYPSMLFAIRVLRTYLSVTGFMIHNIRRVLRIG